jgi:spermidine/putrescine transport system permease protein
VSAQAGQGEAPTAAPRQAGRSRLEIWLGMPALAWMLCFTVVPFLVAAAMSFWTQTRFGIVATFTLDNWGRIGATPLYGMLLLKTLRIAAATTLLTLFIAWPTALFLARLRGTLKAACVLLLFLPFWIGYVVRTFAWLPILGRQGLVNNTLTGIGLIDRPLDWLLYNEGAVYLGLVYVYLLFMVLPIFLSLDRIDRAYLEAAADLGASRWQQIRHVMAPLSLPGVLAGCIMVFLMSFGAYVTPALLGGPSGIMFSNVIANQYLADSNWAFGAALSVLMVLTVLGILAISGRWIGLRDVFLGTRHGG